MCGASAADKELVTELSPPDIGPDQPPEEQEVWDNLEVIKDGASRLCRNLHWSWETVGGDRLSGNPRKFCTTGAESATGSTTTGSHWLYATLL